MTSTARSAEHSGVPGSLSLANQQISPRLADYAVVGVVSLGFLCKGKGLVAGTPCMVHGPACAGKGVGLGSRRADFPVLRFIHSFLHRHSHTRTSIVCAEHFKFNNVIMLPRPRCNPLLCPARLFLDGRRARFPHTHTPLTMRVDEQVWINDSNIGVIMGTTILCDNSVSFR